MNRGLVCLETRDQTTGRRLQLPVEQQPGLLGLNRAELCGWRSVKVTSLSVRCSHFHPQVTAKSWRQDVTHTETPTLSKPSLCVSGFIETEGIKTVDKVLYVRLKVMLSVQTKTPLAASALSWAVRSQRCDGRTERVREPSMTSDRSRLHNHIDGSGNCGSMRFRGGGREGGRAEPLLLVSGGGGHLVVVLQVPLERLLGLLVLDARLLLLLLLRLDLVGVERLLLLAQFGQSTKQTEKQRCLLSCLVLMSKQIPGGELRTCSGDR